MEHPDNRPAQIDASAFKLEERVRITEGGSELVGLLPFEEELLN